MPTLGEPDYYSILGVGREASPEEIKQAYHRLATHFHPDLHPDDAEAEACLRSLNQAYAVLKDPEQRARYDRWGAWGPPVWRPPGTGRHGNGWWRSWIICSPPVSTLEAHKPQRGQDLRYTLSPHSSGMSSRAVKPVSTWPMCAGVRSVWAVE